MSSHELSSQALIAWPPNRWRARLSDQAVRHNCEI
jgi:hypothetical protein